MEFVTNTRILYVLKFLFTWVKFSCEHMLFVVDSLPVV